jgi:hypothetical protein
LLHLDATMRDDFSHRGLRPTAEMLAGKGQINLSTSLGRSIPSASSTWGKAISRRQVCIWPCAFLRAGQMWMRPRAASAAISASGSCSVWSNEVH